MTKISAHCFGKRTCVVAQQPVKRRKTSITISPPRVGMVSRGALQTGKTRR
jgi:hypothetical protein